MKLEVINTLRNEPSDSHRQTAMSWILLWAIGIPIILTLYFFP